MAEGLEEKGSRVVGLCSGLAVACHRDQEGFHVEDSFLLTDTPLMKCAPFVRWADVFTHTHTRTHACTHTHTHTLGLF